MRIIEFYQFVAKLKRTKRAGWVREGIGDAESVSDHSFSTALLAMILAPELGVNSEKFIKMALIHDLGESIIGDVLWYDKKSGADEKILKRKQIDEMKAMKQILAKLKDQGYIKIWEEMEKKETKEAKLLVEIDRLDIAFQAFYEEKRTRRDLAHFFEFADKYIDHPLLKEILKEVRAQRKK